MGTISKFSRRLPLAIVTVAFAGLLALVSGQAFAAPAMKISLSVSTVTAANKVDLTTEIPAVSDVGPATQEIIQSIDVSKVKLTSASDVIAPEGWTLSYSTDGTNYSSSPSSWAAVVKVKANGAVNSGGVTGDGKQLYQTSSNETASTFKQDDLNPRLTCDATTGLGYNRFTLSGLTKGTDYTSASLTIFKANGDVLVSGGKTWSDVAFNSENYVDLTSILPSEIGQNAVFKINYIGKTTSNSATGTLLMKSNSAQLCLSLTANLICPDSTLVGTPGASQVTFTATGSTLNSSNVRTDYSISSGALNIDSPQASQCGFKMVGVVGRGPVASSFPSVLVPIPNAIATLLDASGNVINGINGEPITATTGTDGTFSFGVVKAGTYKVRFFDFPLVNGIGAGDVAMVYKAPFTYTAGVFTMTNQNSANFTTIQNPLDSPAVTGTAGGADVMVKASYIMRGLAVADTLTGNNLAPITVDVTANDSADPGTSLNKASVKLCAVGTTTGCNLTSVAITGKGTYSVDNTGVVTFTPNTGVTGVIDGVTYSITDLLGVSSTSTVTATVTLTPPVITTPAFSTSTIDVANSYTQTVTVGSGTIPATGAWKVLAGALPAGMTLNTATGAITGTPTLAGRFAFTIQVTDSNAQTGTKASAILVAAPPVITTNPISQKVYTGVAVAIPSTATEGSSAIPASGAWSVTGLPAGLSINANTGEITGTPTTPGTYTVVEKVTDTNGLFGTKTLTIKVVTKPVITTLLPFSSLVQRTTISGIPQSKTVGSAALPATGAWSISVGSLPPGLSLNTDTGSITGTPTASGSFTYTLKLTDVDGEFATQIQTIFVVAPPTITTTPLSLKLYTGASTAIPSTATAGGSPIATTGAWSVTGLPAGLSINANTGEITGTPTTPGTYTVVERVVDRNGLSDTETLSITVVTSPIITTAQPFNVLARGVVMTPLAQTVTAGSASIAATGAWSISSGALPAGLSLNTDTGAITGTPTTNGTFTFTVKLVDTGLESSTKVETLVVADAPTITTTPLSLKLYTTQSASIPSTVTAGTAVIPASGAWSVTGLPAGLSINANTGEITGTPTTPGTYTVVEKVTDTNGLFGTKTLTIKVVTKPVITTLLPLTDLVQGTTAAAILQTKTAGSAVLPATGAWSISVGSLPTGLSLNADTGAITGTPTVSSSFTYTLKLTDVDGEFATQVQTIFVAAPPTITTSPTSLKLYTTAVAAITSTATAGTYLIPASGAWSVTGLPAGLSINANTGEITGTPTTPGTYTVVEKVTDTNGLFGTKTLTIKVVTKPVITTLLPFSSLVQRTTISGIPQSKTVGSAALPATGAWSISVGSLPPGLSLNTDTGSITGTPTASGSFTYTLKLTDVDGEFATQIQTIFVVAPPTITTTPLSLKLYTTQSASIPSTVTAGTAVIPASGAWSVTGLPAGLSINANTGEITGTPTTPGTYTVVEKVTDTNGLFGTKTLTIKVVTKPVITTLLPLTDLVQGTTAAAILQTKTAGSAVLPATGAWSISVGSLPTGLSLNADTGAITGTPTVSSSFTYTLKLTDVDGEFATQVQTIFVAAPPTITTSPTSLKLYTTAVAAITSTATAGTYLIPASGAWSVTGLPAGLSINANTGEITGTPTTPGTYTVVEKVTDTNGLFGTKTLTIKVVTKPVITTLLPLTDLVQGTAAAAILQTKTAGSAVLPATGAWSVSAGVLPNGLTLDSATGSITGTPTVSSSFTYTLKLTDVDGEFATQVQTIFVAAPPTITTSPTSLKLYTTAVAAITSTATAGTYVIPATGAWSVTGLPAGLSINANTGEITGTPTTPGTYTVVEKVVDRNGLSDTETLTIKVVTKPVITTLLPLTDLVQGTAAAAILQTKTAGSAVLPATGAWSVSAGVLPNGLTLDSATGSITGTPTVSSSFTYTLKLTDVDGEFATQVQTIFVAAPPTITTSPTSLKLYTTAVAAITSTATAGTYVIPATGAWSVTGLPAGLSINANTGEITGTPTTPGTYTVVEKVIDLNGLSDTETLSITVVTSPIITTAQPFNVLARGVVMTPLAQTVTAGSASIAATGAWSISSGALPAGLSLNTDTGAITGTPTTNGTFTFTVKLVDTGLESSTKVETLVVADAPTITTTPLSLKLYTTQSASIPSTVTAGTAVIPASGAWSVTGLPAGLSINANTGEITGTPTTPGTYTVVEKVVDRNGLSDTETLTIKVVTKPVITTLLPLTDLVQGTAAAAILQTKTAGSAVLPATGAWSVSAGVLPNGLTLDSATGSITGTPTVSSSFTYTLKLTDVDGEFATQVQTIFVAAPPTITTSPTSLKLYTTAVAAITSTATAGTYLIPASGAWSVTGLPAGLSINANTGEITGTPTTPGTYTVVEKVTDTNGLFGTKTLTIKVVTKPVITTLLPLTDLVQGTAAAAILQTKTAGSAVLPATGAWSISVGSLPTGLSLNADTGAITGTPTVSSSFTYTLKLTDVDGEFATQVQTIFVAAPPTITTSPTSLKLYTTAVAAITSTATAGTYLIPASGAWSVTGLPAGLSINANTGEITGTPTTPGTYTVVEKVTDTNGLFGTKTLTIKVVTKPVITTLLPLTDLVQGTAAAAILQTKTAGSAVLPATGAWSISVGSLPTGLSLNADTGAITGTPTVSSSFTYTLKLTDVDGEFATQVQTIFVAAPPTITTSPTSLKLYTTAVAAITSTATAGTYLIPASGAWSVTGLPAGLSINANTGEITGTPTTPGTYTVVEKVTDTNGLFGTKTLTIKVVTKPVITTLLPFSSLVQRTTISGIPQSKTVGSAALPATGAWSISVGSLPPGLSLNTDTGSITGTPTASGSFTYTLKLTDVDGEFATQIQTIFVVAPPTITTTPLSLKLYTGASTAIPSTATAGGSPIATTGAWSVTGLPAGLSINANTGEITGTPTTPGTYTVVEKVIDLNGLSDTETLSITVVTSPIITTAQPFNVLARGVVMTPLAQTVTAGSASIAATGAWSISSGALPAGLSLNTDTGAITGTPTTNGTFTFTVKLVDTGLESSTKVETLVVADAPTITTTPLSLKLYTTQSASIPSTVTAGTAVIPASGAWSVTGLPAGLSINANTGEITGTPTTPGTYTVVEKVTDTNGLFGTKTLTIKVVTKPVITTLLPLTDLVQGTTAAAILQTKTAGSAVLPATGAWSISVGSLPTGLSLNADTGAITGTPTVSSSFTYTLKLTDVDGEFATQVQTIFVAAPPTITTSPTSLKLYTTAVAAITSTATAGTYLIPASGAWSVTGLPAGLSINANTGEITGTPTTPGTYTVVEKVTDTNGLFGTKTLTIKVVTKPVITTLLPFSSLVQRTTISGIPQSKTVGSAALPATGAWSISVGSLPPGLSLNTDTGSITGTPTASGSFTYTLKLTDVDGEFATQIQTIFVVAPPTITTTPLSLKLYTGASTAIPSTATAGGSPIATTGAWSVTGLPAGLSMNANTGEITGTPTTRGTFTVVEKVTDRNGLSDTETLNIKVVTKPVITTLLPLTDLVQGTAAAAIVQTKTAGLDAVAPTGAWSISVGSLPTGLSLNADTGAITGTPTVSSSFTYTLKLTDVDGEFATQVQTIFVAAPPTITTSPTSLKLYTTAVAAITSTATAGTYLIPASGAWSVTGLPAGLSINANTGEITGTPTTPGTYTVVEKVTDTNGLFGTKTLTIKVVTKPVITTLLPLTDLVQGTAAAAILQTKTAGSAVLPATGAWSISVGSLPTGLSLNADTGAITGTPTVSSSFTYTLKLTDVDGEFATQVQTIFVAAPPTITTSPTSLKLYTTAVAAITSTATAGTYLIPASGAWSVTGLPAGLSINANTGEITGTPTTPGTYTVVEKVTDTNGLFGTKTLTIKVVTKPVITTLLPLTDLVQGTAAAAILQTKTAGSAVLPATGAWSISVGSLPTGLSLNADTGAITGTPTVSSSFTYTLKLTDVDGEFATQVQTIFVAAPPTITTSPTSLKLYTTAVAAITSTATAGTYLIPASGAWSVTGLPAGLSINANTGEITGTPTTPGTYTVVEKVTDTNGLFGTKTLTIKVVTSPTITTAQPFNVLARGVVMTPLAQTFTTGSITVATTGAWSISDGSLPAGLTLNTDTGAITGTPTTNGTFTFTVKLVDTGLESSTKVEVLVVADAPTIDTTSLKVKIYTGEIASLPSTANLGSVPLPSDAWTATGLPAGLTINPATGTLTGTPTVTGTFSVVKKVTDINGLSANETLTIKVVTRPVITTLLPLTDLVQGTAAAAILQTKTAGSAVLPATGAWSISVGSLPTGLSLNADTGAITGTPTVSSSFTYTLKLTDVDGEFATQVQTIFVAAPPTITTSPTSLKLYTTAVAAITSTATAGTYLIPASGAWSVTGLPAGLSINANTGEITGTPTTPGTYTVVEKVTDTNGLFGTKTLTIKVVTKPVITTLLPLTDLVQGTAAAAILQTKTAGSAVLPATGAWSISVGSLPTGLSLNADTGAITGTPTVSSSFTYTLKLTDVDGEFATQVQTIFVAAPPTITTSPTSLKLYTTAVAAITSTATAGTYLIPASGAWSVTGLPAGLSINANTGEITGTPTTPGTYTVVEKVTDTNGLFGTKTLTIKVVTSPTITTAQPFNVLARGVVMTPLAQTFTTGSITVATTGAWSISDGSLPAGLTLNTDTGAITGTPTTNGTFTFTVKLVDTGLESSTKVEVLVVADAPTIDTTSLKVKIYTGEIASLPSTANLGSVPLPSDAWTATGLPAGLTINPATGTLTGTPTVTGTFSVVKKVTDINGLSANETLTIKVVTRPVITTLLPLTDLVQGTAAAAILQTKTAGSAVLPATGAWSISVGSLPTGLSLNADTGAITGTPTVSSSFTYTLKLTDVDGEFATQVQTIFVAAPPTITTSPTSLKLYTTAVAAITSTATAGTYLIPASGAWSVTGLPAGLSINANTGEITGTPTTPGTYTVVEKVTDTNGLFGTKTLTIKVVTKPVITTLLPLTDLVQGTAAAAILQTKTAGSAVLPATGAWSISVGSLPTGLSLNADTGAITGTPTVSSSFTYTLKLTDVDGEFATQVQTIFVAAPPTITTSPTSLKLYTTAVAAITSTATAGTYLIPASGAWSVTGLPAGLSINANTGEITGTPTTPGTYTVVEKVTDTNGLFGTKTLTIKVVTSPTITTAQPFNVLARGVVMTPLAQTFNPGSATIGNEFWSIVSGSLPSGLTINPDTGSISGTPTETGSYFFTVKLVNSQGELATKLESLEVIIPPVITTNPIRFKFYVDQAVSITSTATKGSGDILSSGAWTAIGLPPGLSIDSTNGTISGIPNVTGTFNVTERVSDVNSMFDTEVLTIKIVRKPIITTPLPLVGLVKDSSAPIISQTKTDGSAVLPATGAWSISDGLLPNGLTLNTDTGVITGTPLVSGVFNFTVKLVDVDGEFATKVESLTVKTRPTITTEPTYIKLYKDEAATLSSTAKPGTGSIPNTGAWTATGLPAGLTIDPNTGEISGFPSVNGTFSVIEKVTDVNALSDSKTITFKVVTRPLITTAMPLPKLAKGTPITPIPQTKTPGSALIGATRAWSISAGNLPNGLVLNADTGEITGTPTLSGVFEFTVKLVDVDGELSTKVESITVNTRPTITTTPLATTINSNFLYTIPNTFTQGTGAIPLVTGWSAKGLPEGMNINGTTGVISGIATTFGTYPVTVTLTDINDLSDTELLTITVVDIPIITTTQLDYKFGVNNDLNFTADDFLAGVSSISKSRIIINTANPGSFPIKTTGGWSATGLPPGLTINPDTGKITGAATTVGEYPVEVTVTDNSGNSSSKVLNISIVQGPKNTTQRVWNIELDIAKRIGLEMVEIAQTYSLGSADLSEGSLAPFLVQGDKPAPVLSVSNEDGSIQVLPYLFQTAGKEKYGAYILKTLIVDKNGAYDLTTFIINIARPGSNVTTLLFPAGITDEMQLTDSTYQLVGTSSKKLPVTYGSSTPLVCTVDTTTKTLKLVSEGTCTITASSGAAELFSTSSQSFKIAKLQTTNIVTPGQVIPGSSLIAPLPTDDPSGFKLYASVSSGLQPVYESIDPNVCSVDDIGTVTWDADLTVFPIIESDFSCRIKVSNPGDSIYSAAPPKTIKLVATHVEPKAPEGGITIEPAQSVSLPATGGTTQMIGGNSFNVIVDKNKKTVIVQPVSKGRWIGPIYADIKISYTPKGSTKKRVQMCQRNTYGIAILDSKKMMVTPELGGDPLVVPEYLKYKKAVDALNKKYRAMKQEFSTTKIVKGKKVVTPGYLDWKPMVGQTTCQLDSKAYSAWKSGVQIEASATVTRDRRWPTTYTKYKSYDWLNKSNSGTIYPTVVEWVIKIG